MIQRIQSIFLLLAGLGFAGLLKLPFASTDNSTSPFFEDKLFNVYDNQILLILAIGGIVLSLVNIFMFKNRPLQLRLGYILIIFSLFLPLVAAWLFFTNSASFSANAQVDDGIGLLLPGLSLIMAVLANRFIAKDDKLVKSMDRLR